MLAALSGGDVKQRLSPAERLKLLGGVKLLSDAGKLPADAALRLLESLKGEDQRHVVQRSLDLALAYRQNGVPDELLPNYQRFIQKNFLSRAQSLGWTPAAGESDDTRLLRPSVLRTVATYGGDDALAQTGRELADHWLDGSTVISPDMLGAVLETGAYYGDKALALRYLAKLKATADRQVRQKIIRSMGSFRDPAALTAGYDSVLSGDVPFIEGVWMLFGGQQFEATRQMPFSYVVAHWDEIVAKRPTGGSFDLGSSLPYTGGSFCDPASRDKLQAFFGQRSPQFTGGPRILEQVLETVDLCIARKVAQGEAIAGYLKSY
jgi:alanyl aminopeptidase